MTQANLFDAIPTDTGRPETLEQGLVLFEAVGMPALSLDKRTRQEYRNDLTDLIEYLQKRGLSRMRDVGIADLEHYQAEMERRGYKASTRNRKTHAIKTFFRFLHRHGLIPRNVAAPLIPPQYRRGEYRVLSKEEYERLRAAYERHLRDAAIIELLLQTGMQLSELVRLTVHDVELPTQSGSGLNSTGSLRVTRNSGRVDFVPLNYKACRTLGAWLKVRPRVDHMALFVGKHSRPMSARAVQYVVRQYLQATGIQDASVQTLRHTMATHYLARGGDLKAAQQMLGHQSSETTELYLKLAGRMQQWMVQERAL
jgi:site-specific recombinase XerD